MPVGWRADIVDVNRDGTRHEIHGWDGSALVAEITP